MTANGDSDPLPEGVHSLLDTDLYKLTMQSAVLKYFPETSMLMNTWMISHVNLVATAVSYAFTNRTPNLKLNRQAFHWLQNQVERMIGHSSRVLS